MKKQDFDLEQKAVLWAVQQMTDAFQRKDINGIMSSYEPNALVVFDPQPPFKMPRR